MKCTRPDHSGMTSVDSIMTAPPITAHDTEPLVEIVRRMHEHRVGSVVVVKERVPIGIVTERDVLRVAAGVDSLDAMQVGQAMTTPVDTIEADLDPAGSLTTMRERGYRHMPVTRHGELVGVVSLRDLARLATIGPADVPRGLKGVVVADTAVGDVRGQEGFYHYREYSAVDLAQSRPLEDVWRLLFDSALPTTIDERAAFEQEVLPLRALPARVRDVLPAIARVSTPLDCLRTA